MKNVREIENGISKVLYNRTWLCCSRDEALGLHASLIPESGAFAVACAMALLRTPVFYLCTDGMAARRNI